jgi:hypothetical protein
MVSIRGRGRLLIGAARVKHGGNRRDEMVSSQWLRWAILALVVVAYLWFAPQLQGEYFSQKVPAEERPALVNEYRRTWAQIIGGFGLLVGLYFTWRRIDISQQELEATRDQQVTERFTRAIDQLGAIDDVGKNKKLEIRLGGIYALERIAGDSLAMKNSPGRDYSTVMEVLTAYVRENTRQALGPSEFPPLPWTSLRRWLRSTAKQAPPPEPRRPTADIQAILDVLSRAQARVPEEHRTRLDLHEANLREANLQEANLRGVDLRFANLQRADLREVALQGASLGFANLQGADLQGASLQGAIFLGADLQGGRLRFANLQGAFLLGADLQGAFLQGADLREANLREAKVTEEQLADARDLQGAIMPDGSTHP